MKPPAPVTRTLALYAMELLEKTGRGRGHIVTLAGIEWSRLDASLATGQRKASSDRGVLKLGESRRSPKAPKPHAVQQLSVYLPLPPDRVPGLLGAQDQAAALRLADLRRLCLLRLLELPFLRADGILDAGQLLCRPRAR